MTTDKREEVSMEQDEGRARELLARILDYYEGRKPFDFYRLNDEQRANESFDAWQEIAGEIRTFLAKPDAQTPKVSP